MIADLFLRTYPGDFQWLKFLFRSLERHARGWRDLVLVLPYEGPPTGWNQLLADLAVDLGVSINAWADRLRAVDALTGKIAVWSCQTYKDDYLGQCLTKLRAWEYTSADDVAYLDSDLVLVRPWTPTTLRHFDGRSIVEYREWADAGAALSAWHDVTKTLLRGQAPPFETMCRHPFQYPVQFVRRAYEAMRHLAIEDRRISEFNYLGNYAILHERDSFYLRRPPQLHREDGGAPDFSPDDLVYQFWSWGGITAEVEAKLKELGYWEDSR